MWLKLLYYWRHFRAQLFKAQKVEDAPLCIAAVFKNEAPFLKEWIDFHLQQGVGKIYLADNYSDDQPEVILQPYIEQGQLCLVKTHSRAMNTLIQARELNRLIRLIKQEQGSKTWLAVIDIDEFLFHPKGLKINQILKKRAGEKLAAVVVNWLMFGTSGLKELDPNTPMIQQLTWRAHFSLGEHKMVKPIMYLANCDGFLEGPHRPFARRAAKFKYSDGELYDWKKPKIKHQPLRINHYWYRSETYYNTMKREKRRAFGDERQGKREQDHIKACNYERDTTILNLVMGKEDG